MKVGCQALLMGCKEVLRELEDNPRFCELYEGFIEYYRSSNNREPFMPFSTAYGRLTTPFKMSPRLGDHTFALKYGTRGLLSGDKSKVDFDTVPTMRIIADMYNASSTASNKINNDDLQRYMDNTTSLLRFMVDNRFKPVCVERNHKTNVCDNVGADLVAGDPTKMGVPVVQCDDNPSNIISYIESPYQDQKIKDFVKAITPSSLGNPGDNDREKQLVENIIDMNISPINVHALVRELPLAYLYNYEYTFETILYTDKDGRPDIIPDAIDAGESIEKNQNVHSIKPYMNVNTKDTLKTNILYDDNYTYLKEQLENKVNITDGRYNHYILRTFVFYALIQKNIRDKVYEQLFSADGNVVSSYPTVSKRITTL